MYDMGAAIARIGTHLGVEIEAVTKTYADIKAINAVSLSIRPGEFVALLGPSGCGKTTLLRSLSGLEAPDEGRIRFGDQVMVDTTRGVFVPPEKRNIGMVFQDYALWPHMRVRENVAFPLEARGVPKAFHEHKVRDALRRVSLDHLADRFPAALSGGQQQRVALARAIVAEPDVILFDEPLSNLDAGLRDSLGREMARLVREIGMTAVYVTHDQAEALSLADRVAVMCEGKLVQFATPEDLYNNPADAWTASFLKTGALVPGAVTQGRFTTRTGDAGLLLDDMDAPDGPAILLLPSVALRAPENGADADMTVRVTGVHFKGDRYEVTGLWGDGDGAREILFWRDRAAVPGQTLPVKLERERLRLYPGQILETA